MDIIIEAEKLQKALREIDQLLPNTNAEEAEKLDRLRAFLRSALSQIVDGYEDHLLLRY